jgi:hypothetical protein
MAYPCTSVGLAEIQPLASADASGLSARLDSPLKEKECASFRFNADAADIPDGVPTMDADELAELLAEGDVPFDAIALEGFELADVAESAQDGMDAALGSTDVGLPVATLVLSTYREARTLKDGQTDVVTAAKNIAVDAVAKGGGMAAGAKMGAFVGSMVAPGVGTAVGGVMGGVIGGILGGRGAKALRESDAHAALGAFSAFYGNARAACAESAQGSKRVYDSIEASYKGTLARALDAGRSALGAFDEKVSGEAGRLTSFLSDLGTRARTDVDRIRSHTRRFAWIFAPQEAAAQRARLQILEGTPQGGLDVVLTDDTRFEELSRAVRDSQRRMSSATEELARRLMDAQREATQGASLHAARLEAEYLPAQVDALSTMIHADRSLLPILTQATEEAGRASLRSRVSSLKALATQIEERIARLERSRAKLREGRASCSDVPRRI